MRFISLDFDKLMRIIIIPYGERVGETNRKKINIEFKPGGPQ